MHGGLYCKNPTSKSVTGARMTGAIWPSREWFLKPVPFSCNALLCALASNCASRKTFIGQNDEIRYHCWPHPYVAVAGEVAHNSGAGSTGGNLCLARRHAKSPRIHLWIAAWGLTL